MLDEWIIDSPMHRDNIVLGQRVDPVKVELAKQLRGKMTLAEKTFWKAVRRNQLGELHFRRQQIIGGFVVDFYCHEARLAVEIDGGVHQGQTGYDLQRDEAIAQYQVIVRRFKNEVVMESLQEVLEQVRAMCEARRDSSSD